MKRLNLSPLFAAAAVVATLQPVMTLAADAEGAALAAKYSCKACHTENAKLVGPSYHDVAKKYSGDGSANAKLAAKIKSGGSGTWGAIPMPPNNVPAEGLAGMTKAGFARRSARVVSCVIFALAGFRAMAVPSAVMTYDEARTALGQASEARKAGEYEVSRRANDSSAARTLGYPEVSIGAEEVWGIKTATLASPLGPIDINENFQGPRAAVSAKWSIYNGGRVQATQRSLAAAVDESNAQLENVDQRLDLELAQVYFGVSLAADVERTRRSVLVPAVERLNAQVARDEAAREHVRAARDLEIAAMRLQRLLVSDQPVGVKTPLFVVTSDVGSLAHWLGLAERDSPILRGFAARKSQAEQGIVAAEARWKPEVYAYGTYNMIRHYQTAGLGASFTLFAREDRANQVSAAREALRAVESQDGEARNRILTAVEAAFRKVLQAREQFALLESSLAAARENLRLRERGFDEGQATSLDINEARNALARAETARSLAAYQFVVALSELLEASGQKQALSQFISKADVVLSP